jgi:pimeloyl-ACP methyl ester carboxylesterase
MSIHRIFLTAGLLFLCACTSQEGSEKPDKLVAPAVIGPNAQAPDPAVIHANENRRGEIAYKEGYFGSDDTRLHYVEAGEGPLIILYHGFPSFWYSWFDQMEALKTNYRVVAVDGLGSGLSAKPLDLQYYRIARLTEQLDALSHHLGGDEKYVLIGHDWGSVLALTYAQAYPHRLHKVIGMSAPPLNMFLKYVQTDKEQQRRTQYMQRFKVTTLEMLEESNASQRVAAESYENLAKRGDLSEAEAALFKSALANNRTLHTAMNWYRANIPPFDGVSDEHLWPAPEATINVPGLFIWGEKDQIFVPALIDQMNDAGPDMQTIILPGINHWTSMEKAELATAAIIEFIQK